MNTPSASCSLRRPPQSPLSTVCARAPPLLRCRTREGVQRLSAALVGANPNGPSTGSQVRSAASSQYGADEVIAHLLAQPHPQSRVSTSRVQARIKILCLVHYIIHISKRVSDRTQSFITSTLYLSGAGERRTASKEVTASQALLVESFCILNCVRGVFGVGFKIYWHRECWASSSEVCPPGPSTSGSYYASQDSPN